MAALATDSSVSAGPEGGTPTVSEDSVLKELTELRASCITPGRCREKYEIGRTLGRGKFGTVRLGKCRVTGISVAIKSIGMKALHADVTELAALFNEIAILKKISALKHPNLVQFLHAFEEEHHMHIVMNLCQGGELFDGIVKRGHYSEQSAADILRCLLKAVQTLHNNGVIHRDLKPENCLLVDHTDSSEVQVTDFGLSADLARGGFCKNLVGTPGYVAPEVLERNHYTPACDVWSIGVILYILLVGYPPFYGSNDYQVKCILEGKFQFHEDRWGGVSETAKDLVRKMLTVSLDARITVDKALAHDFLASSRDDSLMKQALDNLKVFNAKRKFRAVAMACALGCKLQIRQRLSALMLDRPKLSADQLNRLMDEFRKVAIDGVLLGPDDFRTVIQAIGLTKLPVSRMFDLFDMDGNGLIDYREFVCGVVGCCADVSFKVYDMDGNGFITRDELSNVLLVLGCGDGDAISSPNPALRLESVFEAMDTNMDGLISFAEFKAGILRDSSLAEAFLGPLTPRPLADDDGQVGATCAWPDGLPKPRPAVKRVRSDDVDILTEDSGTPSKK